MSDLDLVVTVPSGKVQPSDEGGAIKVFKFPVILSASNAAPFDHLVSSYFREGASIFKPSGYEGISTAKPQVWAEKGGQLHLSDAGIEGKMSWLLELKIVASEHIVTLKLKEMSY